MILVSIDPGLHSLGWARWNNEELVGWGLLSSKDFKASGWKIVAHIQARRVRKKFGKHSVDRVISEIPQEFQGAKGAAALASGSVRKLAYLVGVLGGGFLARGIEFETVEPLRWKGNLPKHITRKRVLRAWPEVEEDEIHDVIDAIGIGMYYLRVQKGKRNE